MHRSTKSIVAILAAVLALLALLCVGVVTAVDTIVADVSRDNLCTADRDECFVDEPGTVVSYDEKDDEVVVSTAGETVALSAPNGFDDPPVRGTRVVLQRWEGGEVAWMIDLDSGKRHGTSGFRGNAGNALLACLVTLVIVSGVTFNWLRGY